MRNNEPSALTPLIPYKEKAQGRSEAEGKPFVGGVGKSILLIWRA